MIPALAFGAICLWLRAAYNLPLDASFSSGAAAWVFFYIPGRLIIGRAGGCFTGIKGQMHSFAVGSALIVPAYSLMRTLHLEALLLPSGALMVVCFAYIWYRRFRNNACNIERDEPSDIFAFAFLLIIALILLHFSFFSDVRLQSTGFDTHIWLNETYQHLGLVNVLTHTYPPSYPYISGLDFSHYHIYMHLQIEMINRVAGTDTLLLTFYMMPMMYLFLILWLTYTIIMSWTGSRVLGAAAGAMMFCSNLAWIPELMANLAEEHRQVWETLLTPTLYSLVNLNGFTPSVYIMLLVFHAMREYFRTGSRSQLVLFAALVYTSYGFKSSMGLQLLMISGITGILYYLYCDDKKRGKDFVLASAMALAVLAINLLAVRKGMGNAIISFAPFGEYKLFLQKIGAEGISFTTVFFWPPVYMLLTFGSRTAGLLMTLKAFRRNFDPLVMLLVLFSISGVVLAEIFTIESPSSRKNALVSFSGQSLIASWLLLALWLGRYAHNIKKLACALALIFALSLPTSLQLYGVTYSDQSETISQDDISLLGIIRNTSPDAVFIYPERNAPSPATHLGGRQGVLDFFYSFAPEWAGKEESLRRLNDVSLFFNAMGGTAERSRIIGLYNIDYVYAPLIYKGMLGADSFLKLAYQNNTYVMYAVAGK